MEFNDGSAYRIVTDPAAHMAARDVYCFRAASARNGVPYIDTAFNRHRETLAPMRLLLLYQFVWQNAGTPEEQARFLITTIGALRPNEAVMLDIEAGGGITDPVDFTRRWLAVVEPALKTKAWVYVPSALADRLTRAVTGDRLVMAPRYSGTPARGLAPWWPHDVHQYTDQGPFPGCPQSGDTSHTALTTEQLLARSRPKETPVVSSYNGWTAGSGWSVKGGQLEPVIVAGEPFAPGVRKGDVAVVLRHVAEQLHRRVEPITKGHAADDWGYNYRLNRNANNLSCHSSGTAIDFNAARHPNGKSGTFTATQVREIRKILAEVNNTVRWGGDFSGTKDEMHFEILGSSTAVAAAARKIRTPAPVSGAKAGDGILEIGDTGDSVKRLQETLNRWYPNLPPLFPDGDFGPATDARVRYFQEKAGLTVDGVAGPATLSALGLAGLR